MEMALGDHPCKFVQRVDRMVKELEMVDQPVEVKDVGIVVLSALTFQYDAEFEC